MNRRTTDVLVIGSGPVGLTLAMDLAQRGVTVTIVETRHAGEPPNVKCNHVAARTMEIFRRLGIVDAVRNTGLPADYPNDISYRTTMLGTELSRIPIPCRRDRYTATGGPDTDWPTPEPPHRINQTFLEPVLFEQARARKNVTILNRTEYLGFVETGDGIVARIRDMESGQANEIEAAYMIGCDGGRSQVRRDIGGKLVGDAVVQRVQSTFIRAPDLLARQKLERAWAAFSLNPRRSGNVYAIDGVETWLIHSYMLEEEPDFDSVDRDRAIRDIIGAGPDFTYEIISKEDWFGRRLVADKFRAGRVFLCGDAAHIWVPFAGYGMNAGIADAENLAWLLAGRLKGWGAPALLDAYVAERQPITEQVSRFAMNHAIAMTGQRRGVPSNIEDETPAGEAARRALGQAAYDLNVQQYCCGGLNFGYYYEASPLVVYDGETAPPYTMQDFTPSTVPGCRTPHLWLKDNRSLYDAMGDGYTLLRFDRTADPQLLLQAAAARSVPMTLLDVESDDRDRNAYRHKLLLSRPDRHVAWRGDAVPRDPKSLIETICGAGVPAISPVLETTA